MILFNRPFDDRLDKIVLGCCFLVGVLIIITLRGGWFNPSQTSGISLFDSLATFLTILVIFFYCAYILLSKFRTSVSIDTASDNAYYLGLLFTLTSLAVSLLKMLSAASTDSSLAVNSALLPDFGLALFSTISGIVGRIVLQQMRPEALDVEVDATKELARLMRIMQGSIQNLVGNLDGLNKQAELSMSEMVSRSESMVINITEEVSKTIIKTTKKNEDLSNEISDMLHNVSKKSAKKIEQLANSSVMIAESIENLSSSHKSYQILSDKIESTIMKQIDLTESLNSAAKSIDTTFSKLNNDGLVDNVGESLTNFKNLNNELSNITSGYQEINKQLAQSSISINSISENISDNNKIINNLVSETTHASSDYVDALADSAALLRRKGK